MKIAIFSYPKKKDSIGIIKEVKNEADIEALFGKSYFGRLKGRLESAAGGWIFWADSKQVALPPKVGYQGWRQTATTVSGGFETLPCNSVFWIEKR